MSFNTACELVSPHVSQKTHTIQFQFKGLYWHDKVILHCQSIHHQHYTAIILNKKGEGKTKQKQKQKTRE